MSVNVLYQTAARATGGRDGRAATLDGTFAVSLTTPKELGGPGGNGACRSPGEGRCRSEVIPAALCLAKPKQQPPPGSTGSSPA